jgi:sirohydrochlorin ferrochelatase
MKEGIIILGHGSRREDANLEIREFTDKLREKNPDVNYQVAFLEFAQPSLDGAVEQLLKDEQVKKIIIMPLFLTVGNHMHRNIPDRIWKMKNTYPKIKFALAPHLGLDYRMMDVVQDRIKDNRELE